MAEKPTGYSLGEWKGYTQYLCDLCPFDTLDERGMIEHIEKRHTPKVVRHALPLVDQFGNTVMTEEVVSDGKADPYGTNGEGD